MNIFIFIFLCCLHFFTVLYPVTVAVQKPQATQPIHQSTYQVLQKKEIFGQHIVQCYNAFLQAQKIKAPHL